MLTSRFRVLCHNSQWNQHVRFFQVLRALPPDEPDFPIKRVFESYLLTLVEAWLRDLAYHWNSEDPPGSEELGRAGLLEKLEGGTTQRLGA
jgi:hypothetical protein